ncbi:DUF4350 domain-containing protein [Alloalcanivorax marinus]|uniref:DUF4350 domain-containing protein n=1 Tax=Alloalcanivorax marinus TaxID=1177169 RepID=UPI0019313B32|nr:DUF4350 domain-containing protein [Alloalcanivorax marinus]MBL7249227.1 DUF4350 domain-containing protein [Alloalcanivorax marinus]
MKRWLILFLLLVAGLVAGYYWATEPVRYMAPAHAEAAARDPYLAARTLLDRWQRPSRRVFSTRALFPLPATDTTLILDEYRGDLGRDRIQALLDWVAAGGTLIVAARPVYGDQDEDRDRADPLLEGVGVHARRLPDEDDDDDDPMATLLDRFQPMESLFLEYCLDSDDEEMQRQCERLTCEIPETVAPALTRDFDGTLRRLRILNNLVLRYAGADNTRMAVLAENDQGLKLITLTHGAGVVTVLAGLDPWDNDHLLYFDHAWLLRHLTGDGPVWFVQGIDMPPLPLWLWEHAWPPILALVLALTLWLWRRLPRPGPLWQPPARDTTDYLGHLRALGHFYWRTGQGEALLAPLRDAARRRLALLHPDPDRALALAAERLAMNENELRAALGPALKDRPGWTRQVAVLQRIRSRL